MAETVAWFCRQDARWSAATGRQYQAALRFTVRCDTAFGILEPDDATVLLEKIAHPPLPKSRKAERLTSAKKRRNVPYAQFEIVIALLDVGDELDRVAGRFLYCNVRLGLRPIEWQSAVVAGSTLEVLCAKNTNGRAVAEYRPLELDAVFEERPDFLRTLEQFIQNLHGLARAAGSWATLWSRLASRIARACRSLSVKRIALYTGRHIAIATAKQIMTPIAVAAFAGHASARTAGTHYARHGTGFAAHITCARPAIELLDCVRQPPRAALQPNGRFRREVVPHGNDSAMGSEAEIVPTLYPDP